MAVFGCASPPPPTPAAPREAEPSATVTVEGLVSLEDRGFPGARVELLTLESLLPAARAAAAATMSAEAGRFQFSVPPGKYFLLARSPGRFAWFGRNPVRANAHQRGLSLPLVTAHPVLRTEVLPGEERIVGRALLGGRPVEGVLVSLYLRPEEGFKGPPYAGGSLTGPDGAFQIPVEPGAYFLVARRRASGEQTGPLAPGDFFGIHPELPLRVKAGQTVTADFEGVELPDPERMSRFRTRFAALSGRVVDAEGRPVEGMRACLYDNPRLLNDPLDVSPPTGPDGRFLLHTTREGRYFLGAREKLGGPPASGERVGFPRPAPEDGYLLAPGSEVEEITLVVQRAP